MNGFSKVTWSRVGQVILFVMICIYPLLAGTVRHGGGTVYILLAVVGLFFVFSSWPEIDKNEKRLLLSWLMFGVFLISTLAYSESIKVGVREAETFWRFLMVVPIFLLFSKAKINLHLAVVIGLCLGALGMGGMALMVESSRAQVQHLDPIKFGQLSALYSVLLASLLIYCGAWRHKLFMLFCALFGAYAAIMSGTRSAWLALLACVALILFFHHLKQIRTKAVVATIAICLLVVLLIMTFSQSVADRMAYTVAEVQNILNNPEQAQETGGLGSRYNIWLDSLAIWRMEPIFGIGIGDYVKEYEILKSKGLSKSAYRFTDSHNVYIHMLTVCGVVGLILFLFCLVALPLNYYWANFFRHQDAIIRMSCISGMVIVIAYVCFGMSEVWVRFNPMVNSFFFFSAVFLYIIRQRKLALN